MFLSALARLEWVGGLVKWKVPVDDTQLKQNVANSQKQQWMFCCPASLENSRNKKHLTESQKCKQVFCKKGVG